MDSEITTRQLDRARFAKRWRALGASDDRAFEALVQGYSEAHRAYHDGEHIAECLAWADQVAHLAARLAELEIAIYFHDAVYAPLARDNEARSAALFCELAREAGIGEEVRRRVASLIESTAGHDGAAGDSALLSDVDLAILGASPARYARFEDSVRREYAAVADEAYRAGRARVLRSFLERMAIYRTAPMAALLEAQARRNLSRALDALSTQAKTEV